MTGRYVPKWVNSVWVVMDRWTFKHLWVARDSQEARTMAQEFAHG